MKKTSTTIEIEPLAGLMDARSAPKHVPRDGYRLVQNFRVNRQTGKLSRAEGWKRLLDGYTTQRDYNNEDLHDQLLELQTYYDKVNDTVDDSGVLTYPPYNVAFPTYCGTTLKTRAQGRQPITFLAAFESSTRSRKLLAGTQSRLYALNQRRGNWRIVADGCGGTSSNPEIRWKHAIVGDYCVLTNNYDAVRYWTFDAAPSGCEMQSAIPIQDLQTINVTRAACVCEFKGVTFLANIEEDGQRKGNMVRWSEYGDPLSWIEDPGVSLAGHQELDSGEEVLAMAPIGDFLYIYTNRGVWQVAVVADAFTAFNFQKRYSSAVGDACIAYPHSFVSVGDGHFYMAKDGIYAWSPYDAKPDLLMWIHRGSAVLYDDLNESVCAIHTAGYDPLAKEVHFSVAQGTSKLPSVTLVCNIEYKHTHKRDAGFSAFCAFIPDDRQSIYDWIYENEICSDGHIASTEVQALGFVAHKEGPAVPLSTAPIPNPPNSVHTSNTITVNGITTEDYTQVQSDNDSLCALFPGETVGDQCANCESSQIFIGASASDYCLKQFDGVYYRQHYDITTGTYSSSGYTSRLVKWIGGGGNVVAITRFKVEYDPLDQAIPSEMKLLIGASTRVEDPTRGCDIAWNDEGDRPIDCNMRDEPMEWNTWAADTNLYFELKIEGTGGGGAFESADFDLQKAS